jgi:hypothetical protein
MPVTIQIASVVADERFRRPAAGTPTAEQVLNAVWKAKGVECKGIFSRRLFPGSRYEEELGLTMQRTAAVFIRTHQGLFGKPSWIRPSCDYCVQYPSAPDYSVSQSLHPSVREGMTYMQF